MSYHWNRRYLKYSKSPESREGHTFDHNDKRHQRDEKSGDVVICVDDSGQNRIKNGKSYIINDTETVGMTLKGIEVYYRYDRFMSVSDYRELMITEILE